MGVYCPSNRSFMEQMAAEQRAKAEARAREETESGTPTARFGAQWSESLPTYTRTQPYKTREGYDDLDIAVAFGVGAVLF